MSEQPSSRLTLGGAASATAGTALVGAVGDMLNVAPWWAAAATAPAVASLVRAHMDGLSLPSVLYRAACWSASGAWIAHAIASDGAWTLNSWIALGAGGAAAWILGPAVAWRDRAVAEQRNRLLMLRRNARLIAEWQGRLARVCGLKGHQVQRITPWDNGYGFTVLVSIVGTGRDWQRIKPRESALATDADLPHGCGVEVCPGPTRGTVEFRVGTRDAFEHERMYPVERVHQVSSIDDPISFGFHRDGTEATITVRWRRTIAAGQPDQGKTNELNVITAEILRTHNGIVRIISPDGGGLAWRWLKPWLAKRTDRPVIDWVAPDDAEAAICAEDTLWEVKRRKRLLVDDDKLPAGDGRNGNPPPEIFLIIDEGAEIGGAADTPEARRARAAIAEIKRIGRAVSVNVVDAVLRGTTDMTGGTASKRLSGNRIQMRITDAVEAAHLFGQEPRYRVDPQDAPYAGCGWYTEDGSALRTFRGWRMTGDIIDTVALACTNRRPEVHPSPRYAGRWDRIQLPNQPAVEPAMSTPASSATRARLAEIKGRFDTAMERWREQRGDLRHDPQLAAQFDDVVKGMNLPDAPEPPVRGAARMDARTYMVHLVQGARDQGVKVDELQYVMEQDGYRVSRATVYRWLEKTPGIVNEDGRFYWRGDGQAVG